MSAPMILPCPFCGVVPTERNISASETPTVIVKCLTDFCALQDRLFSAIAWNTRAPVSVGAVEIAGAMVEAERLTQALWGRSFSEIPETEQARVMLYVRTGGNEGGELFSAGGTGA